MLSLVLLLSSYPVTGGKFSWELLATEVFCALDIVTDLLFSLSLYKRKHHVAKMIFAMLFSAVGIGLDIAKVYENVKYCFGWCTLKAPVAVNRASLGSFYASSVATERESGHGKAALVNNSIAKKNKVLKLSVIGAFVEDLPQMAIAIVYWNQRETTDAFTLATIIVSAANCCLKMALLWRVKQQNQGSSEETKTVKLESRVSTTQERQCDTGSAKITKRCICGAEMQKCVVSEIQRYNGSDVFCDYCDARFAHSQQVFHCPIGCSKRHHEDGYVVCVKCRFAPATKSCICGAEMEKRKANTVDESFHGCMICSKIEFGHRTIYHCPLGYMRDHGFGSGGYNICIDCSL